MGAMSEGDEYFGYFTSARIFARHIAYRQEKWRRSAVLKLCLIAAHAYLWVCAKRPEQSWINLSTIIAY
eukprot:scaffold112074_cov41-Tisochrysis_lutea.AAC.3